MSSVKCECGCVVGYYYLPKHKLTQKHYWRMEDIRWLEARKPPPPPKEPTIEDVLKKLEELDEKIDDLKLLYDKLDTMI